MLENKRHIYIDKYDYSPVLAYGMMLFDTFGTFGQSGLFRALAMINVCLS